MRGKQVDGMRVHHNTDMKTLLRDKCVEVMKLETSFSPYEGKHHHMCSIGPVKCFSAPRCLQLC